jgi:hypothetical protein
MTFSAERSHHQTRDSLILTVAIQLTRSGTAVHPKCSMLSLAT